MLGGRSHKNGAKAAAASRKKPPSPIARAWEGSHSQIPSHESARKSPTTVASLARGGHKRSQKSVQCACAKARRSISLPEPVWAGTGGGGAAFGVRSFNAGLSLENRSNFSNGSTPLERYQPAKGRRLPDQNGETGKMVQILDRGLKARAPTGRGQSVRKPPDAAAPEPIPLAGQALRAPRDACCRCRPGPRRRRPRS